MTDIADPHMRARPTDAEAAAFLRKTCIAMSLGMIFLVFVCSLAMYVEPKSRIVLGWALPPFILFFIIGTTYMWRLAGKTERGEVNRYPERDESAWMNQPVHIPHSLMVMPGLCALGSIVLNAAPESTALTAGIVGTLVAALIGLLGYEARLVSRNGGVREPGRYKTMRRGFAIELVSFILVAVLIIGGALYAFHWTSVHA